MINRNGIFKGRNVLLFVAFLAIPLLGWNALPESATIEVAGGSRTTGTIALQSISAHEPPTGNMESGRDLFMGRLHFENSGPPCMGCHNIGSNGILGGGALGPDLTNVTTKRSQSELAAILSNSGAVNVPVMQPIYAEHPLTAEEQADLLAFMAASAGQPEANREWLVVGISLAGLLAAIGLLELVYHRRLRGVRKPMLRRAHTKKA